jgi:hypothetical protein
MATVTKPDRSLIAVLGPLKMEVVALTAVLDGESFTSKLANPSFALAFSNGDATDTASSAAVSGKTVTIHDPGSTSMVVIVFGDSLT